MTENAIKTRLLLTFANLLIQPYGRRTLIHYCRAQKVGLFSLSWTGPECSLVGRNDASKVPRKFGPNFFEKKVAIELSSLRLDRDAAKAQLHWAWQGPPNGLGSPHKVSSPLFSFLFSLFSFLFSSFLLLPLRHTRGRHSKAVSQSVMVGRLYHCPGSQLVS